jgi:hypothetical protein
MMRRLLTISVIIILSLFNTSYSKTIAKKDSTETNVFDDIEERSKVKFRFIPTPFYDASIEWGITFIPLLTFHFSRHDTISPPSMAAAPFMLSTNGSRFGGIVSKMNFNEDNWRTEIFMGKGNINQLLFFEGLGEANVEKRLLFIDINGKRRIWNRLYGGLGYTFNKTNYFGRDEESQEILDIAGFESQLGNHGIKYIALFDNRDNIFYPYKGLSAEFRLEQYFSSPDGDDAYLANIIDARHFIPVAGTKTNIIAWRFFGRFLTGNPTQENYSFYGREGQEVQRGYEVGTYIDKNMVVLEAEYRRETSLLKGKLGFAAFSSMGKVFGDYNSFSSAELLPAVGFGTRYRILPYERMNVRLDFSWGKDGFAWYFSVGEAF